MTNWYDLNEELKQHFNELERQIEIAKKLENFRETRSIALAVEICDTLLEEMDENE